MSSKKDKLVALKEFADLETGRLNEEAFVYENALYRKAIQMKSLSARIRSCHKCQGLNIKQFTEACPGWGNLNADIFFIGQSLHEPGVLSGLPFILASGMSIDAALRLSGLLRKDVFFSNVVHCHPPNNRASTDNEKINCLYFLAEEISIVQPKLLVALGNDAHWAVGMFNADKNLEKRFKVLKVKHPASFMYSAPEDRIEWIVKLSLEMDKVLGQTSTLKEMHRAGERFEGDKAGVLQPTACSHENPPRNVETDQALLSSLPKGKFKTIYIDPPWPEVGGGKIRRGADKHYKLMSVGEIEALAIPIDIIAAKNCHLYLWVTNNYLKDAFRLLERWNFKYITTITWLKDRKGLGQYYRGKTEHCLFARRGILPYRKKDGKRAQGVTGFIEKRGKHSTKPQTMREMIELVSPPPRIELFARERFKGWSAWGDEV